MSDIINESKPESLAITIRRRLACLAGLPHSKLSVNTSPGKAGWISVRIRPNPSASVLTELTYPGHFPEPVRRAALTIVYGPDFCVKQPAGREATAGNVGPVSIALLPAQWHELLARPESQIP